MADLDVDCVTGEPPIRLEIPDGRGTPRGYGRAAGNRAIPAEGEDRRVCTRCGRVKPLGQFHDLPCGGQKRAGQKRKASWCRACVRIGGAEWRQTAEYRAWLADYLARPEVRDRRRDADRARQRSPARAAARKTARAKLLHCRRQARAALKRATDPARRAALEKLIAAYTGELARMDARRKGGG